MGNNFSINKSGLGKEEIAEKIGIVPEAITSAESASSFEANYKEPVFKVEDGKLKGGDDLAMKIFMEKFACKEETEEVANVVEESSVVANMAFAEVDPTCCQ